MNEFRVTAQVQPYVEALGLEKAVEFVLAFGGSYLRISTTPHDRSEAVQALGREAVISLASRLGTGSHRIHSAKPWLAAYFRYKRGWTVNATARKLHVTDVTVRNWLGPKDVQLDLFQD